MAVGDPPQVISLDPASINSLAAAVARVQSQNQRQPNQGANTSSSNAGRQFDAASRNLGRTVNGLTGFLNQAGGSVSSVAQGFASVVPGINLFSGAVGDALGYLEETQATFQSLSKVGAGFNGDLGALRSAAAQTGMRMGDFANMIGRNAQALAGLGSGVNDGAKRFSRLSRTMREEGLLENFMNLGYNLQESNQLLIDYATLTRRQNMLSGRSDKEVAAATLRMAENMQFIAEITGESAEAQKDAALDAARDGKNIAALRALEARGITDAQGAFATANTGLRTLGPAAQALYQDYVQAGAPLSKMTQNFEALNPQVAAQIRQIASLTETQMDAGEKQRRIQALLAQATTTGAQEMVSGTNLAVARLGAISDIGADQAARIQETENMRLGIEQRRADLARQQGVSAEQITFQEAADSYFRDIQTRVGAQSGGGAEGQAISRDLNRAQIALIDAASRVNVEIGRNLSANTAVQEEVRRATAAVGGLANTLAGFGQQAITRAGEALGGNVDLSRLTNFNEVFEPFTVQDSLRMRLDDASIQAMGTMLGMSPQDSADLIRQMQQQDAARDTTPAAGRAVGGPIARNTVYRVGENGPEDIISGFNGTVIPNMQRMASDMQQMMATGMPVMESQMQTVAQRMAGDMQQMMATGMPVMESQMQTMAQGMQRSMSTFMPNLRGLANRTREQAPNVQGNIQQMMDNLRSGFTNEPATDNEKLIQQLENLNKAMYELVAINSNVERNTYRQSEAIRGAGNLLQGVTAR